MITTTEKTARKRENMMQHQRRIRRTAALTRKLLSHEEGRGVCYDEVIEILQKRLDTVGGDPWKGSPANSSLLRVSLQNQLHGMRPGDCYQVKGTSESHRYKSLYQMVGAINASMGAKIGVCTVKGETITITRLEAGQ